MKRLFLILVMVVFAVNWANAEDFREFNEVSFTVGGYGNNQDLRGGYIILEGNHWLAKTSQNISFLGGLLAYEPGDVNNYEWKKFKIIYQPGLYQALDDRGIWNLLLKPRVGYCYDRGTQKDEGLVYGGVVEIIKTINPLNKVGLTLDSMHESRKKGVDSYYVGYRPFYERVWLDGKSLKISAGPTFFYLPDDVLVSKCLGASLRLPINGDFFVNLGLAADFGEDANTYGFFVSINWNDIHYVF